MRPLAQLGITPNILTFVGLLLSMATAGVIAQGYLLVGGLLVLFAGIFDMFDGALARVQNAASTFGAFLDSTLDRYSESIILFGLLWYALQARTLHESLWPFHYEQTWLLSSIYIAVVGSLMVSYAKARAEGLGLECKTGLLARPERVVILAIGLITGTVIWAVIFLAIFSNVTAIERIVHIWRATMHARHSRHSAEALAAVAQSQQGEFSADGHDGRVGGDVGMRFIAPTNRQGPIDTSEGVEPSIQPVHTSVPPFNRSVQQE